MARQISTDKAPPPFSRYAQAMEHAANARVVETVDEMMNQLLRL